MTWLPLERALRYLGAAYVDLRLFATGKRDRELPPLRLRDVGTGDFRAVGRHLAELFIAEVQPDPKAHILDIGCGAGRVAIPLTHMLPEARYDGFDVMRRAIRWCRRNITSRHPHFRFHHVSVRNSDYSLLGVPAARFTFPFDDATFDCAFAFSLFTHLDFEEMRRYLRESARVLRPGGKLLATFFLLNDFSLPRLATLPVPHLRFPVVREAVRFADARNPAFAVAVDESRLRELLSDAGFKEIRVLPGVWTGRESGPTFQDVVVCQKR
jgi:SAM-dependent methyltransferase